ncbi:hypothetical protein K504DRAFT_468292 [Pleomassaria siparia CBS 279.74]|uniref:Uncharacterized protein n=1 Tax=Pleomassaria siparia CBS 279.74 TaxID=1314801 RepID=A0A6G1K8Y7_9PLEO|nr:hypothetical protein K504DRAFT_468292 [Pleomassaria siparia CBS 279.74]
MSPLATPSPSLIHSRHCPSQASRDDVGHLSSGHAISPLATPSSFLLRPRPIVPTTHSQPITISSLQLPSSSAVTRQTLRVTEDE